MMYQSTCRPPCYTRDDLKLFNLLEKPVWVFDIERKAMWWANNAAIELWSADSLDSLLNRNFADMSEATVRRLADYVETFKKHKSVNEQVRR